MDRFIFINFFLLNSLPITKVHFNSLADIDLLLLGGVKPLPRDKCVWKADELNECDDLDQESLELVNEWILTKANESCTEKSGNTPKMHKKWECTVCIDMGIASTKESLMTFHNLKGHLRISHLLNENKKLNFSCKLCPRAYPLKDSLYAHMRDKHPVDVNKIFKCEQCSYTVASYAKYEDHLFIHNPAKFQCSVCGENIKNNANMRSHLKKIHNYEKGLMKNHICPFCNTSFPTVLFLCQ